MCAFTSAGVLTVSLQCQVVPWSLDGATSVTAAHVCCGRVTAATGSVSVRGCGCVPIKLYSQGPAEGQLGPQAC